MRRLARLAPLAVLLCGLAPTWASAEGEDALMQQAVRDFVKETGFQVVGLGSWIGGKKKYTPGVSDHDMRLILPDDVPPEEARRLWVEARKKLSAKITATFKASAGNSGNLGSVLELTNFYPPDEMMGNVPDMDKAWEIFKEANTFPNLAAKADRAKIGAAEGIYGNGSKYWRQKYEASDGSWFYRSRAGEVVEGSVETIHAAERVAAETMGGRANVAGQWIEHAWDTMREGGSAKTVGKYLQRMGEDLDQTMKLGNLKGRTGWLAEARALGRHLQNHPSSFQRHEELVRTLLKKGYEETAIATEFAASGPAKRQLLRALHTACRNGSDCLITRLIKRAKTVGRKLTFGQAAELASLAMDMNSAANAETEQERAEVIYGALAWTGGWPVGFMSFALEAGREEAEALGIATVAQFQDVWNMMAGLYSSTGRAGIDTVSWTLGRLVAELHDEQQLRDRVATMARRAAMRGFGARTGERDDALAERLFDQAWPVVAQAWTERRAQIKAQIGAELRQLKARPLQLSQTPTPATIEPISREASETKWQPVDVVVSLDGPDKRVQTAKDNIIALLKQLGETGKGNFTISQRWDGGTRGKTELDQVYQFDAPGKYKVAAQPRIFVTMTAFPDDVEFNQSIDLFVGMTVWVVPPENAVSGLRAVRFHQEEDIVMVKQCRTGSSHSFGFTFPIQGGEITDFYLDYWIGFAVCLKSDAKEFVVEDDTCSEMVRCQEMGGRSRLISGFFDGGDGGAFSITYRLEEGDGDASVQEYTGRIWADGWLEITDATEDGGEAERLSFPPF